MTRRMIDSGMWSNENFAALPPMARLLQIGMINHADDQGRIKANPLYLAREIFPYDNTDQVLITEWLEYIVANGTLILYVVEGKQYAQLTKWWEYQSLQYAAPSDYPPPPKWRDRIRRTATKGLIVTYNWTLTSGALVPDTCDRHGKPLTPRRQKVSSKLPSTSTPPVNGSSHSPVDSPELPPEPTIEFNLIELNLTEDQGGDRARATEPPPTPPANPPPSYRPHQEPNEYIPGVRHPQYNQTKRNCDHYTSQANKLGVGPEPFRLMVDAVLQGTGKMALANTSGELGQKTLNRAKDTVITLLEMNPRTVEDIEAILASWRADDYRGASPPTFEQVVEHASAMLAGTHVTRRRQDGGKKDFSSLADYNEWAAVHDPKYERINEGILVKGTFIKRADYQPARVH